MGKPIFAFFLIHRCPDCRPYFPIWEKIVQEYDNREDFLLAEADCRKYPTLRRIYQIGFVPSFLEINKGECVFKYPEPSIESFKTVISSIFTKANESDSDLNTNGQLYRSSLTNYPIFVIGSQFLNPRELINKYENLYPHLHGHFYYTDDETTKGFMIPFESKTIFFENNSFTTDFDTFVYEYSFDMLGDWRFKDAINASRRFAFVIYTNPNQCYFYHRVIHQYYDGIIFGKIAYRDFRRIFPNINIVHKYIPSLAVANKYKTRFTLLNTKRNFADNLGKIINDSDDFETGYSLRPIFPSAKGATKPYLQYFCWALGVIACTGFIILHDAQKCIKSTSSYYNTRSRQLL